MAQSRCQQTCRKSDAGKFLRVAFSTNSLHIYAGDFESDKENEAVALVFFDTDRDGDVSLCYQWKLFNRKW
jgi:hypothetical protein